MIFKDIIFLGKFMKKILGMGNAVLDVLVKTSDEYLEKNNLSKGTMIIVEEAESK
ncbi:MAG: hypothetical protein CFH30_00143, partial [Alphaproteobacteria bacterium MarineAlpha8_Bin1]